MKKIGIVLATILWIGTAVKYITVSFLKDTDVLSAFQTLEYSSVNAKVVAYGTCDVVLDEECKQEYVKKIISELGIMSPYDTEIANDGNKSAVYCKKNADNGSVKVEFVSTGGNEYIGVVLDLKDNISYVYDYESLIKEIFAAEGIKGEVNIYLEGRVPGALNYNERKDITDELLKSLDAKVVSENRDSEIFTIYAYTDNIPDYIKSVGRKININLSAEYDEISNETVIYLATPINNLDY